MAEEVNFVQNLSNDSFSDVQLVDFGCIAVDTSAERVISIMNLTDKPLTYRISVTYILNNIDHNVFKVSITSSVVMPGENADLRVQFSPNVPGLSFTNYFIIDDTVGNTYRLTVTGKCYGPEVTLSKRRINFKVVKNVSKYTHIKDEITIVNASAVETTYQWILPCAGQGYFQISTGTCGLIRAFECITSSVVFSGRALGVYAAELVCLVLNQEPLYLDVLASVVLPENPHLDLKIHTFEKTGIERSLSMHLMQNSLNRLPYVPHASVHNRYLDFDRGSVTDNTRNIAQTLCVTNHEIEEGFIQWIPDPDNIFIIDPVDAVIPPKESRQFSVRFRPKLENEVYGYLLCGDYQQKVTRDEKTKMKHCLFRIPCIGNTWCPCTEWTTEWECPTEVIMPPTVPCRTTFKNFMLSNKFEIPMYFKFEAPRKTNFVVLPMCGIVPSRGWEIITVALEPKALGDYYETWDLVINKVQKARICFNGNAEVSQVEIMSHGYNPEAHAMFEFPPTITGTTNYCVAYFHNLTRMYIHMRVLSNVDWLGADNCGTIILSPKEIISFHWWFFPKTPDLVYDTTVTCTCVCLINGRPVGEPQELFVHIYGFSEYPNLKIVPKKNNLHDVAVGQSASCTVTLMNFGSCYFTSRLYHTINGLGDDHSGDKFEIDSPINSLKPNNFTPITFTIVPDGAGMRQIDIKYTILYRTEYDEIEEIQPIKATICKVWYDGIYPTIRVKRTISGKSPVIMSDHCVWNISNVEELNKALEACRPNKPLSAVIYAPDICLSQTNNIVEYVFVVGCVYDLAVPWSMRRKKLCDCEMVEVQTGISTFEMRHTCIHRQLVVVSPLSGTVLKDDPNLLHIVFSYTLEGRSELCYVLTMPNQRVVYIYFRVNVLSPSKCCLHAMRRGLTDDNEEYMVVTDCGTVPINNLDPIIRIVWLYNPTEVFATWRLLPGNTTEPDRVIRCLLFFAEVPPMGRLAIPFAFLPSEMIDYDMVFRCSVGPNLAKIRIKGHGGLPNFTATRLDMPRFVENIIKGAHRNNVVYLSINHITVPDMPTHALWREIVAICNDTDHVMRFIWLPERIANIVNIVMTPCWGVIKPKSTEWITMTVYCLQEPATFTSVVACELLDLTERMKFQQNELLRRRKIELCQQEFIITEFGKFHPNINDSPPYVENIEKPQPTYIAMTVSISSKGQRDGSTRIVLNKQWEHTPPYDLLCEPEVAKQHNVHEKASRNNIILPDIIRIIDGILWDALQSKMFRNQIEYYANEDLPTHGQVMRRLETTVRPELSRRVTSGICDAIVNKAVFQVHNLNPAKEMSSVLQAE